VRLSLEELMEVEVPSVVGASRFAQQVVDAPASVTIVTSDEIERFGYRTFADVLRGVRGFYINYDRNYHYVGARGVLRPGDYNSRILLLLDGHRLNDNIYDGAPIGTDLPIDLELIERVEIVRGPSSSLYGTSAFFAVVNVITRRGSTGRSEAGLTIGSQSTIDGRVAFARRFVGAGDLQLSASQYGSDGELYVPVVPGVSTFDMDHDRASRLFGSYTRGRWKAQALYSTRTKGISTGAYGTSLTDPRSETTDGRAFVDLRYERAFRGTSFFWAGSYDRFHYDGVYADLPDQPLLRDFAEGAWWVTEVMATSRLPRQVVTVGSEIRNNVRQDQAVYYESTGADGNGPADRFIDDRRAAVQWALHVQDEVKLSKRVIVNAGIRYDYWPSFGGTTNPRVALIVKPAKNASLKLLHGTAFRAPNLYELYYYGNNPADLKPERIRTSELVWEQHLQGPTRITASAFRYRIDNLIAQVAVDGIFQDIGFANLGVNDARGVEAELERGFGRVQLFGSYTFTSTGKQDQSGQLSNSPRHLGVARASTPLFDRRATLAMSWVYTSERRTLTGETTSGFALGDLTLASGELAGGLRVSFDVHNVLDQQYSDPGAEEHLGPIRQNGRTARAKVTWRF
jgi:iron complex outermembrane receptor protein